MTASRATNAASGFTLIELLVTMTLLSLVLVVLFGGLQFGVRAWDGAEAHGTRTEELLVVQDLLRRELEQAYPRYDVSDPMHPVVDFRGGQDWVTFLAPSPTATGTGGRDRIVIWTGGEAARAYLAIRGVPENSAKPGDGWSTVLVRDVRAVRISYLSSGAWRSTWTRTDGLPALIRIQVAFRSGDGRAWPDLIVSPRIESDVDCTYDPGTRHCRGRS